MAENCHFCRIAQGGSDAHEIYRDAHLVAFLDNRPIRPGHVQIIPIEHVESFEALHPDTAAAILHLGQRLALVQKRLFGVPRVGFLFTGGDIPHAHAHVVPMAEKTDITSRAYFDADAVTFRASPLAGETLLAEVAARLRTALLHAGA